MLLNLQQIRPKKNGFNGVACLAVDGFDKACLSPVSEVGVKLALVLTPAANSDEVERRLKIAEIDRQWQFAAISISGRDAGEIASPCERSKRALPAGFCAGDLRTSVPI